MDNHHRYGLRHSAAAGIEPEVWHLEILLDRHAPTREQSPPSKERKSNLGRARAMEGLLMPTPSIVLLGFECGMCPAIAPGCPW